MAAVSLFWDTNMAAVTSCENTLLTILAVLLTSCILILPGELWVECAAELMAEETNASHLVTETDDSSWRGVVLAAALYTLNCCPIHSRYLRRGLGEHKPSQLGEFLMTAQKVPRVPLQSQAMRQIINLVEPGI